MSKIMILQHVSHEPLGTLNPMLKAAGFRIRYINFARTPDIQPTLDGYDGLIVLGGPMGVYEAARFPHLTVEIKLIEEALKRDLPVLGICLGAQLIAATLGAQVRKARQWEMGWYNVELTAHGKKDPWFQTYRPSEKVFQLHHDEFDPPSTALHLAYSEMVPGQAFRYGDKVYGMQFHLEVDQAMILRWLNRAENRNLIKEFNVSIEQLQADTRGCIDRSLELSQSTFSRFIEMFELPDKQLILGSR